MNWLEILLGQLPEPIFYGLFMIYAKGLHEKRTLFVILTIIEYFLCKYTFPYSWFFHISFMVLVFLTLKVLYKEKSQVTDIFIFIISYIVVIISSILCFIIFGKNNMILVALSNRLLLFIPLFIFNYKLYYIQKVYKKYWNRNDKVPKKVKTVTFRGLNIIIFNILFYVINLCMVLALLMKRG